MVHKNTIMRVWVVIIGVLCHFFGTHNHQRSFLWMVSAQNANEGNNNNNNNNNNNGNTNDLKKKTRAQVPMEKAQHPKVKPVRQLPKITHRVYLDVEIESKEESHSRAEKKGRILIGLFGNVVPKTVENFRSLCACDSTNIHDKQLPCYKGSIFHRIIPNFMMQGGDYTHGDGTGGKSVLQNNNNNNNSNSKNGHSHFDDESFAIPHNQKYLVSMSNKGIPNTNGSQFFITTVKTSWLDRHHVVFGIVLDGFNMVKAIDKLGTYAGTPKRVVRIVDSGELATEMGDSRRGPEPKNLDSIEEEKEKEEEGQKLRKGKRRQRKKYDSSDSPPLFFLPPQTNPPEAGVTSLKDD